MNVRKKARYRQFSQFGIEVLGTEIRPDAEVIEWLMRFQTNGLKDLSCS
jgi:histidyl-tRNA synthetase